MPLTTRSSWSNLTIDLLIHLGCFVGQLILLVFYGFRRNGPTPPFVYPFFLILSAITVQRLSECRSVYGTRLILLPALISIVLYGFGLINEMGTIFWAYDIPRWYPIYVRILWMQSGLLFIHPEIFPRVIGAITYCGNFLKDRGFFGRKAGFLYLAAFFLLWIFRSQNISSDGFDWLRYSELDRDWTRYLREPLGTWIFHVWVVTAIRIFQRIPDTMILIRYWFYEAQASFPDHSFYTFMSIALLNILCFLPATWCWVQVVRELFPKTYTVYVMALILAACGYTQLFAGNIEVYALLQTGLAIFFLTAMRYLLGRWPAWSVGIVFGLFFSLHLSVGWWLPAFLLLPYFKSLHNPAIRHPFRETSEQLLGFTFSVVGFWIYILLVGYHGDMEAMWTHFWGDQVMLTGADAAMFHPLSTYLTPEYYLTQINVYFCIMPGIWMLLGILVFSLHHRAEITPIQLWLSVLTGFYFIYSIVWHNDRPYPYDWDLFSGLTVPCLILLGLTITRLRLAAGAVQYLFYQTIVFSGLYLILQILHNHLRITEWLLDV